MITVERSLTNAPIYVVGVKRGWSPWHRLAQVQSLELALDLIHNDAASLGHWSTAPLEHCGPDTWITYAAEDTYDVWYAGVRAARRRL